MLATLLVLLLILGIVSLIPAWPHSRRWGYYPSGTVALVLLAVVILLFLGWI